MDPHLHRRHRDGAACRRRSSRISGGSSQRFRGGSGSSHRHRVGRMEESRQRCTRTLHTHAHHTHHLQRYRSRRGAAPRPRWCCCTSCSSSGTRSCPAWLHHTIKRARGAVTESRRRVIGTRASTLRFPERGAWACRTALPPQLLPTARPPPPARSPTQSVVMTLSGSLHFAKLVRPGPEHWSQPSIDMLAQMPCRRAARECQVQQCIRGRGIVARR